MQNVLEIKFLYLRKIKAEYHEKDFRFGFGDK